MKAKKFLALIFAGAACISLAACDAEPHTHTFSDKWSFDENEHWHEATCDDTDEVKDRGAHTYENGICTVCGAEQPVVLTEDTDFDALVSDKVTKDEWIAAFAETSKNDVTIRYINEGHGYDLKYFKDEDGDSMLTPMEFEGQHTYTEKTPESRWSYTNMDPTTGEISDSFIKYDLNTMPDGMREEYIEIFDKWMASYTMVCPDLSEFYDEFTYDDEKGAYVYNGNSDKDSNEHITTNSIMEYWNAAYWRLEVKIVDGKLAMVKSDMVINPTGCTYFYDYGTTEITLPDAQTVDISQMM